MAIAIKQGDQYYVPITLKNGNVPITNTDVEKVEIVLGGIRKTYPEQVEYFGGSFQFPVTQEETFALNDGTKPFQVRVKFTSGDVVGADIEAAVITLSVSKEVL